MREPGNLIERGPAHLAGGQFDGLWNVIEARADIGDLGKIRRGWLELMTDRLGIIDKKPDRGAHPVAVDDAGFERRHLEERFSFDPKRLPAARQDRRGL
ncbi:MAG: hypothetical protein GDA40_05500 [Rhodobacteraceae bacterium]|nr:hypothetical protein [Paracoccaceae bacterium]